MNEEGEIISVLEIKRFVMDCFTTIGVSRAYSEIMTEVVVGADIIGHHSHGVFRLDKFIEDIQRGTVDIHISPKIEKETSATAWVNGRNTLGPVVGNFCSKIAIAKAKKVGAAIVVANNSNNFGVTSHYSKQALDEGLIGLAFTNSSAILLPNRAKYPISGTNPISVAAPGFFDFFLLDMATSVCSGGNIEIKSKNSEYLPDGWAANAACMPETNGDVAVKTGRFLPIGSYEESGGYKGTGLSIMVDILCGVLGGAAYGEMVGSWMNKYAKQRANVGHCFIVIDPKYFAPDFEVRMSQFLSSIRKAEPKNPNKPIRVPGDRKKIIDQIIEEYGGIWYPKYIADYLIKLSETFKIKRASFIPKAVPVQVSSSQELSNLLETEKRASEGQKETESAKSEKEISSVQNVAEDDVSFIVEDPSDWLCPFSDDIEELNKDADLLEKRRKELMKKGRKLSKLTESISVTVGKDVPIFTKLDEIMET